MKLKKKSESYTATLDGVSASVDVPENTDLEATAVLVGTWSCMSMKLTAGAARDLADFFGDIADLLVARSPK